LPGDEFVGDAAPGLAVGTPETDPEGLPLEATDAGEPDCGSPAAEGEGEPLLLGEADAPLLGEVEPPLLGEAEPPLLGEAEPSLLGEAEPSPLGEAGAPPLEAEAGVEVEPPLPAEDAGLDGEGFPADEAATAGWLLPLG